MPRFVLLYKRSGDPPLDDLARIRAVEGLRVLEHDLQRLLLVDAPEAPLRALIERLASWTMESERSYDVEAALRDVT